MIHTTSGAANNPKFSVISVTKDDESGLQKTLKSIESQTCSDYEVVVIYAPSQDNTESVLNSFSHLIDKWEKESRPGIYPAMNQAVQLAEGEWTIFLNSGDSFYSDCVLAKFSPENATELAYGRAWIEHQSHPAKYNGLEHIWKGQPFCHQALFSKTTLLRSRPFDTSFKIAADYDWLVRAHIEGRVFEELPLDVCLIEPPGTSGRQMLRRYGEKYKVARKAFPGKPHIRNNLKQFVKEAWWRATRA